MADPKPAPRVLAVNPETGERGYIAKEDVPLERATGGRPMTDKEIAHLTETKKHDQNLWETKAAGAIGKVRGVGEAFGVPVDPLITETADLFGKKEQARAYLNDLKTWHPYASGVSEMAGQAAGFAAGGELLGLGGAPRAATALGRVGEAAAGGALRGGIENMIAGSTSDLNEAALGDHKVNGEKTLATLPKHFLWGAVPGGAIGGAFAGLGEAASRLAPRAAEALEGQSSRLIGRELGASGEEAGAMGARVRADFGGSLPVDSAEMASLYGQKQSAYRAGLAAEHASNVARIEAEQAAESAGLGLRHESSRARRTEDAQAIMDGISERHSANRDALASERERAVEAADRLAKESDLHAGKLKSLASDLDKVKGAERPNGRAILQNASEIFHGSRNELAPPSPRAMDLFNEWTSTFEKKHGEPGALGFSELQEAIKTLDVMETRQRVVSGWGSDPEVKRALDALRDSAKSEFDRASSVTAAGSSEATSLNAERLRQLGPELKKARRASQDEVANVDRVIAAFEKTATEETREATRLGKLASGQFEKGLREEARDAARSGREAVKGIGKAQKSTPFDDMAKVANEAADQKAGGLPLSAGAAMGALISLFHGNLPGAALAVGGGLVAGQAKAKGNILGARVLHAIADQLSGVDKSIARGAFSAVRKGAAESALAVTHGDVGDKRPKLTYERVTKQVRDIQANPMILESRLNAQLGPLVSVAPQIYSSTFEAATRAQSFLASVIPAARKDPFSPTAHLEPDSASPAERYDFMQYVGAISDPIAILSHVRDGSVNDRQVAAVAAVYPGLYAQMKSEVARNLASIQKPMDYETGVHVGTLLGMPTSEVMMPAFQKSQAEMYAEREKEEKISPGSPPRGPNARMSKASMSGSQKVESGEGQ